MHKAIGLLAVGLWFAAGASAQGRGDERKADEHRGGGHVPQHGPPPSRGEVHAAPRPTEVPTGLGIRTLLTFTRMDTGSAMISAVRTLVFTWTIRGRTVALHLVSAPNIASGC